MTVTLLDATAEASGFSKDDLRGPSTRRPVSYARFAAWFVGRTESRRSYAVLGMQFARVDHKTVYQGVRRAEGLIEKNPEFAALCQSIRSIYSPPRKANQPNRTRAD